MRVQHGSVLQRARARVPDGVNAAATPPPLRRSRPSRCTGSAPGAFASVAASAFSTIAASCTHTHVMMRRRNWSLALVHSDRGRRVPQGCKGLGRAVAHLDLVVHLREVLPGQVLPAVDVPVVSAELIQRHLVPDLQRVMCRVKQGHVISTARTGVVTYTTSNQARSINFVHAPHKHTPTHTGRPRPTCSLCRSVLSMMIE